MPSFLMISIQDCMIASFFTPDSSMGMISHYKENVFLRDLALSKNMFITNWFSEKICLRFLIKA